MLFQNRVIEMKYIIYIILYYFYAKTNLVCIHYWDDCYHQVITVSYGYDRTRWLTIQAVVEGSPV